jgi:hypothetical protein
MQNATPNRKKSTTMEVASTDARTRVKKCTNWILVEGVACDRCEVRKILHVIAGMLGTRYIKYRVFKDGIHL